MDNQEFSFALIRIPWSFSSSLGKAAGFSSEEQLEAVLCSAGAQGVTSNGHFYNRISPEISELDSSFGFEMSLT